MSANFSEPVPRFPPSSISYVHSTNQWLAQNNIYQFPYPFAPLPNQNPALDARGYNHLPCAPLHVPHAPHVVDGNVTNYNPPSNPLHFAFYGTNNSYNTANRRPLDTMQNAPQLQSNAPPNYPNKVLANQSCTALVIMGLVSGGAERLSPRRRIARRLYSWLFLIFHSSTVSQNELTLLIHNISRLCRCNETLLCAINLPKVWNASYFVNASR